MVSRRHAELRLTPAGLVLTNLSGRNYIEILGKSRISPSEVRILFIGDCLIVGGQQLSISAIELPTSNLICANPTCGQRVEHTLRDCPWCGTSLAFAVTRSEAQ
ncbi:MAG: hypothetical protein ACI9VR_000983 [Cognaticolwellia sp.]|jgi:hypothetical protein